MTTNKMTTTVMFIYKYIIYNTTSVITIINTKYCIYNVFYINILVL